jgi:hypothetical protein
MKRSGPRYLMWYDDNPKVPLLHKIEDAIAAYTRRFAVEPNVVLVNETQAADFQGVAVRAVDYVRCNTFWVGRDPRMLAPH